MTQSRAANVMLECKSPDRDWSFGRGQMEDDSKRSGEVVRSPWSGSPKGELPRQEGDDGVTAGVVDGSAAGQRPPSRALRDVQASATWCSAYLRGARC